ncbi:UPF0175 family protein [Tunicatimonas pelagia]|uniref:UPF0175 family protein n=1 Tax=Tunicatimonas pelagia TaxID=931531 RepID=UPI002665B287|nr:UPF0175 family protein [Tunicatimonas pelagia]WKN41721.1 UPF0175 family protein [Tunicatimonas pelagia]
MEKVINVEYPEFLANSLRLSNKDFESEIKISALIKLYELGKVSSGTAAKALELSRIDFLELLGKYQVTFFGDGSAQSLNEDMLNA